MRKLIQFLLVLGVLCFIYSCSKPAAVNTTALGMPGTVAPPVEDEYRIHVGDRLTVRLFYNPDLNQDVVVRPDGRISLQLVHDSKVVGLTPAQLTENLIESYSKYLQQPEVTVIVTAFAGHKVFVGGEVGAPGVKELNGPTSVLQAIVLAGGLKTSADANQIVLLRKDEETDKTTITVLDIEKAMKGIDIQQNVYLKPYDIVLAPRSAIGDVDLWIDQYIRPFTTLGSEFFSYWAIFDNRR
jgi:polysaccharide biosynthesis/export protein